ncbi:hypothetical protein ACM26W_03720 [Halomonas sp. HK25]|uniref:hypothetical protein n=1 Tax=Halomonas sp. HK25 TaxID=3394321 RepID=UPI0039FDCE95
MNLGTFFGEAMPPDFRRWDVIARNVVATLRTVPDLVWALIFVVAVGLGPLAGIGTSRSGVVCGAWIRKRII